VYCKLPRFEVENVKHKFINEGRRSEIVITQASNALRIRFIKP
jgi:hypothetical protein